MAWEWGADKEVKFELNLQPPCCSVPIVSNTDATPTIRHLYVFLALILSSLHLFWGADCPIFFKPSMSKTRLNTHLEHSSQSIPSGLHYPKCTLKSNLQISA